MDPKRKVESGYDAMARQYLASKDQNDPDTAAALDKIAATIPKGARVLDLGCGGGIPVTRMLADRGFSVTGVDLSSQQLELARKLVPEATFIKADMTQVAFEPASFSAVVSFYAIIHVPRSEQPDLIRRIYSWLEPGGMFLATWATETWEGEEENWEGWGAPMWWSHYGAEENVDMLRDAGFGVVSADHHTGAEHWLWVLARKPEGTKD